MQGIKTFGKTCMVLIVAIVAYLMLTGKDPVAVGNKVVDVVVRRDPSELIVGRWIPESVLGMSIEGHSVLLEFYADGSVEKFDFATEKGTWEIRDGRLSWSIGRYLFDEHHDYKVSVTNDTLTLTEGRGAISESATRNGHPYIFRRE